HNMHDFVRNQIVRGKYKDKPRPILLNSWEAAYFNVNASRIVSLAAKAKEAGAELLVMDDGWFKGRNGETSSLGDWTPDKKKIPAGLEALAERVHEAGIDFGIWVEPEMINEDSDLFRAHPEYAMTIPGRENSLGRNQMLLDLTNPEVVDYVKDSMRNIFKTPGLNYVKWDMNRMFSDVYSKVLPKERQGETLHRYYIGLYDILKTLTEEFPDILFEGCASGGNRTDLGILSYMPQIWASDDTDAIERTRIQTGLSYGYPMSSITSHVSACPNHQTLRNTPMDTRFNVAAFGVLGYELNLSDISGAEFELVKEQIALYKEWRDVFFGGDFYRLSDQSWMVVSKDKKRAAAIIWKELCRPNDFYLKLKTAGLDPDAEYHVYNIAKKYNIKLFGDLINQMAPIHIKKDSLIHNTLAHFIKLDSEKEDYTISGQVLNNAGIKLSQAFGGTGIGGETRLFQDFYSRMYFMEAKDR
ncbi:MAG: alpha-galactosidase, partial [Lachnospiraceae bacterium]|nr:alpha-galactosidase [Lachnospiraceae bacterium]